VNGVLSHNPAEKIVQKTVSARSRVLTAAEQEKVLDAAEAMRTAANPDLRPYVHLRLLLETGLKKGECLHLMTNHVELEGPEAPRIFVRYPARATATKNAIFPFLQVGRGLSRIHPTLEIKNQVFPWSQRRLNTSSKMWAMQLV
jgi:integrase/recombinase XerD